MSDEPEKELSSENKSALGISFMVLGVSLMVTFALTLGVAFIGVGLPFLVLGLIFMGQKNKQGEPEE